MSNLIEVHVGTDFLITCGCGFEARTKKSDELHRLVDDHESATGHIWPDEEGDPND